MKKSFLIILISIVVMSFSFSFDGGKIQTASVKNLEGKKVNTSSFSNLGKPMIISFWATWCKPCKQELDAIALQYEIWQKETGVKLIAISIDDKRTFAKVAPLVKEKGWKYEVYTDESQEFKNAMSVSSVPYTILIDGTGAVVWSHSAYNAGDENTLYENVKKLINNEKITH